jgi:hypothetical protein
LKPKRLIHLGPVVYGLGKAGGVLAFEPGEATPTKVVMKDFPDAFDLVACDEAIYVSYGAGRVARIDPIARAITREEPVMEDDALLACDGNWLYGAERWPGRAARANLRTLETTSGWNYFGARVDTFAAAWGWIFAGDLTRGDVSMIDANALTDGQSVRVDTARGAGGVDLLPFEGRLWSVDDAGCVTRVDVLDARYRGTLGTVGGGTVDLVARPTGVFALSSTDPSLTPLSEARHELEYRGPLVNEPRTAVVAGGRLAVVDSEGTLRFYPLAAVDGMARAGAWAQKASCSPRSRSRVEAYTEESRGVSGLNPVVPGSRKTLIPPNLP